MIKEQITANEKKYNKWIVALSILIPVVVAALFGIEIEASMACLSHQATFHSRKAPGAFGVFSTVQIFVSGMAIFSGTKVVRTF